MNLLYNLPSTAINSDLAFWGNYAVAGNYNSIRVFDISDPANPNLLTDFPCFGPQNDVSVWEQSDGDLMIITSVDSVLTSSQCGAGLAPNPEDQSAWEGLRFFEFDTATNTMTQVGALYQDCGSHTHTQVPMPDRGVILVYNSSYSLRPGPSCGPTTGPQHGRDPLHGVIQVSRVPIDNPGAAQEIAEPRVTYPGDPDRKFDPQEHGLPGIFDDLRACHDIGVFLGATAPGSKAGDLGIAGGACAEQAQMWRINRDGLPETTRQLWIFDDNVDHNGITGEVNDPEIAVDFWHTATFSWDGRIVNFSDESFGSGCPTTTPAYNADTGRTFFLDINGNKLSHFQIPRTYDEAYCSTHQGNVVPTASRYLLVQAWYLGGADVVDFTDPANPREVAFWDFRPDGAAGSDNWSHYWYEGPQLANPAAGFVTYGQDGVRNVPANRGFEVFQVNLAGIRRVTLDHLNPQTQEAVLFP
jgi:hypothetical protein